MPKIQSIKAKFGRSGALIQSKLSSDDHILDAIEESNLMLVLAERDGNERERRALKSVFFSVRV